MNNMKKFFAFSIATAMVAGAVWAGTPAVKSLASSYVSGKFYAYKNEQYLEIDENDTSSYTEVYKANDEGKLQPYNTSGPSGSGETPGEGENTGGGGTSDYAVESVKIFGSENVYLNEPCQFSAYVNYSGGKGSDHAVTWECDKTDIATVNLTQDGSVIVNPIKVGTATITATSTLDKTKSDSLSFTVVKRNEELRFKNVDLEKGLTIEVGDTFKIKLIEEDAKKYPPESYNYRWDTSSDSSKQIATVTDGMITGMAEGQCGVYLSIETLSDQPTTVAFAEFYLKVVPADTKETTTEDESSKQNATPIDPKAPTAEAQAKQEQTPESIANYQKWLATYGGGTTAAAGTTTVSGTVGQPGAEAIVNTASGAPVAMFQSNDATNTLLAAPVGVVPSGTKIETVEAGKDSAVFKAAQNRLSSVSRRGTVQKVYGITALNADGSQITTLNGKAAMSMPVPTDVTVPTGRALKVYLIPDNGQPTKLDTLIDQGRVVFEIPKFGTFAFVVE